MTREGLNKALIDLGWIAITERALDLRPAESHALRQLMRRPGQVVTWQAMAAEYDVARAGWQGDIVTGSRNGVALRVQRVAQKLADVGCCDVVEAVTGVGYVIPPTSARRIEAALLAVCGIELDEVDA